MVAVTVFLAATLLFIGLFNQTIQTAVIYQQHRVYRDKNQRFTRQHTAESRRPNLVGGN